MTVQFYIDKFQSLRAECSDGHIKAHKVCLLFAVIELIEQGFITQNKILFNKQLKETFVSYFEQLKQGNDTNHLGLAFYHLQTSNIWHLNLKTECHKEFNELKSITDKTIVHYVNFAYFDDELFNYLINPIIKKSLKDALSHYLGDLEVQYRHWARSIGKSDKTVKS